MPTTSAVFALDKNQMDGLVERMEAYGDGAVDRLDEALKTKVAPMIAGSIDNLIPVSGRRFKGHTSGAKGSQWVHYKQDKRLSITVTTVRKRQYLYFPDDGSSTKRHAGMQDFFGRGMDAVLPQAIDACFDSLTKGLEG